MRIVPCRRFLLAVLALVALVGGCGGVDYPPPNPESTVRLDAGVVGVDVRPFRASALARDAGGRDE